MKRPVTQMPRRARTSTAGVARTPKEAAIHLVRLEFDASRLRAGIEQAENRAAGYKHELTQNQDQRKALLALLAE